MYMKYISKKKRKILGIRMSKVVGFDQQTLATPIILINKNT